MPRPPTTRLLSPWQMLRNADDKAVHTLLVDAKTVDDKAVGALADTENADDQAGDTLATAAKTTDDKAVSALVVTKTADGKAVGALVDADTADEKAIGALADADTADDKAGDAPLQMPIPPTAKLCRPGRCQARQRQSYYWHGYSPASSHGSRRRRKPIGGRPAGHTSGTRGRFRYSSLKIVV
jgi:hypothetical protein